MEQEIGPFSEFLCCARAWPWRLAMPGIAPAPRGPGPGLVGVHGTWARPAGGLAQIIYITKNCAWNMILTQVIYNTEKCVCEGYLTLISQPSHVYKAEKYV